MTSIFNQSIRAPVEFYKRNRMKVENKGRPKGRNIFYIFFFLNHQMGVINLKNIQSHHIGYIRSTFTRFPSIK